MRASTCVVAILLAIAGCSAGSGDQSEAADRLRIALDAWLLGDGPTEIEQDHPDMRFNDVDAITKILLRYEIGPSRSVDRNDVDVQEFAVTLVFQSEAGTEIREMRKYIVMPPSAPGNLSPDKWDIRVH